MTNKESLDIFVKLLNGNKQAMILKARQTGKSNVTASLMTWKHLYDKHERAQSRKERIKSIFNI